jgi:sulfoxide reductase catalytic subunit YedY
MADKMTPESLFQQRRHFVKQLAIMALIPSGFSHARTLLDCTTPIATKKWSFEGEDLLTPENKVLSYNNYYEFTDNKKMVKHLAKHLDLSQWSLTVDGLVKQPLTLSINDILDCTLEDRTYRLRCVEGWSMVVPWRGLELSRLLAMVQPLTSAKYVQFEGMLDQEVMIGQSSNSISWPYIEGLRLDEANHPLSFLATGLYGKSLSKQNGAPLRLLVPWKYGYKSIKGITRITLTDKQPLTTWEKLSPSEYGFYANVNPDVSHPRWSQRREVRLGEVKKIKTKMLNGYENEVKDLYKNDNFSDLL